MKQAANKGKQPGRVGRRVQSILFWLSITRHSILSCPHVHIGNVALSLSMAPWTALRETIASFVADI